jgi:hypothetical protein
MRIRLLTLLLISLFCCASASAQLHSVPMFKAETLANLDSADREILAFVVATAKVYYHNGSAWTEVPAPASQAFPVGSIFVSAVSTNPATLLGYGTWVAFGAGRTLVGIDAGQTEFDVAEETGGAKTHTLTEAEMPVHTHVQNAHSHVQGVNSTATGGLSGYTADTSTNTRVNSGYSTSDSTAVNQNAGSGAAHNNLQPFIVVYFWKRTA